MGRDKATLRLGRESLLEGAVRRLETVCSEVLVADGGRQLLDRHPSVDDGAGAGPAAGILGAAAARPHHPLLVLACDLPAVTPALLDTLLCRFFDPQEELDWVVPRWGGRLEPLCALYGPQALAALAAAVEEGILAPHRLAERAGLCTGHVEEATLRGLGDPERLFANLNTPEDLRRLEEPHPSAAGSASERHSSQGQIRRRKSKR